MVTPAAEVHPWRDGAVYYIATAPERVSDIALQPGETLISVAAGDTGRWVIGDAMSGSGATRRTHILVKPAASGLRTNLMAKNYIDNLSEETRKGMLEKAEQGIWPTVAPLGYRNVMGGHGKRVIEVDPETAPFVVKLFEWFSTGMFSLKQVGNRMRAEGMAYRKSHKPIGTSSVHKILRSRIYTGEFDWLGKRYQGSHEPLVSVELWERVQGVLDGRHTARIRGIERDFLFTGMIKCGHCGCLLVGDIKKKKKYLLPVQPRQAEVP